MKVSVIIPTLNEVNQLGKTLDAIPKDPGLEVLVADGGSQDGTVELALSRGVQVVQSPPGRACQLNRAVTAARGEILLFLHADTILPAQFMHQVEETLRVPGTVLGAFRLRIDAPGWTLRCVESVANFRSRFFSAPYGDQAIFLTGENFSRLHGFREIPIMDDHDLVRRARRLGRIMIAREAVQTSARRWQRLGVVRTTLLNWVIVLAFRLGVSPLHLAAWYRREPAKE